MVVHGLESGVVNGRVSVSDCFLPLFARKPDPEFEVHFRQFRSPEDESFYRAWKDKVLKRNSTASAR